MKKDMDERLAKLEKYDTPTITNVVATYPHNEECLGLYNPWECNWYTDETCKCIYPELGPKAGYAVTVVMGAPDPNFKRLSNADIFKAIDASPKPVILAVHQQMPDKMKAKNGMFGAMMTTAFKKLGCIGCVSDGPSRDFEDIRKMDFQYLLTGKTAGHGDMDVYAVNIPISVCGMDVAPGEIIHMDENGAVKFPSSKIDDVLRLSEDLIASEGKTMEGVKEAENVKDIIRLMCGFEGTEDEE